MKKICEATTYQTDDGDYLELRTTHVSDRLASVKLTDLRVGSVMISTHCSGKRAIQDVLGKAIRKGMLSAGEAHIMACAEGVILGEKVPVSG